jgi:F-type H+-transporting ATPase subunit b
MIDAAPAAGQQQAQDSGGEVDVSAYRHSGTVKALARLMHVDTETAAKIFEYANFGILAVGVLFLLLTYVPAMMRERREQLARQLVEARNATAEAKERLRAVEAQFARLDDEIAKIRLQAERDGAAEEVRIKSLIEAERQRIVASAEQEIRAAVSAGRRDLKQFAGRLAIDRAEQKIHLTDEGDQALIRQFAAGLDGERRNGGRSE